MSDPRTAIQQALAAFGAQPLPAAAAGLFATLGYQSKRTMRITSVKQFCEHWDADGALTAKEHANLNRLTAFHFLFQLTDAELSTQNDLFTDSGTVDGTRIHSYLFLATELRAGNYSRTDLTAIARALNKPLKMPALVLFKHGDSLSLAVLHRRLNKVAADRDVLEKATLIKDIRCAAPHRAHVEILADLAFESLRAAHSVTNFVQLHAAWRETLDIQELNKRFYRELQHWYFWALGHVRFPDGAPKDADDRDSLSLIRLLTRLIFVWFLKEKGLVPENLFDARALPKLLKGFAPASPKDKDSVYYRAVLQNLFFATLNCEPDQRGWTREGQNMMAHSLYRHREDFAAPSAALDLFKDIPFLNGGLFECLDKDLGEGAKLRYVRIDGFSRRDDSQPVVPDFLFFGPEQDADLSAFYEEKKSGKKPRATQVRGLLEIFHDFKFTIEENTPLEEDVALDPELLGRVFENLLAAYNPETQVTARKQTGSFYTPREIVDYMTGQALFYALREKLQPELATKGTETGTDSCALSAASAFDQKLQAALAHDDAPNPFNSAETARLIAALDDLKILDPACGSGAFPMGVLHRLVHLLGKLDPGNTRWKKRQLDKAAELTDHDIRDLVTADIEEAFAKNELGYGRKLYLIENCLYGVDIQPIAAQITKLRFFISLIVEQRTDPVAPNRGIRPLPNLETKIVAANTLLGIARPGQQMLRNLDIDAREAELRQVRDDHFLARTPKKKAKCRENDARLRKEIATLLKDDGWDSDTAKKLSAWDPYDQNTHADFFDNEWMFGLTEGFDVVIGNPPYVLATAEKFGTAMVEYFQAEFASAQYKVDLYHLFIERGCHLLSANAVLSFIVPNQWFTQKFTEKLRRFVLRETRILELVVLDELVFSAADVHTALVFFQRANAAKNHSIRVRHPRSVERLLQADESEAAQYEWAKKSDACFETRLRGETGALVERIRTTIPELGSSLRASLGCQAYNGTKHTPAQIAGRVFHADRKVSAEYMEELAGNDVGRYVVQRVRGQWIKYGPWLHDYRERDWLEGPRILVREIPNKPPYQIAACYVEKSYCNYKTILNVNPTKETAFSMKFATGVLNSRLLSFLYPYIANKLVADSFPRISVADLRRLPFPNVDLKNAQQRKIHDATVTLVDQILAAKRANAGADTRALEAKIDRHVYDLYGLTPEEIKIVEGTTAFVDPLVDFVPQQPAAPRARLDHPAYFQLWIRHALSLGRDGIDLGALVASAEILCTATRRKAVAKEHTEIGRAWLDAFNVTPTMSDFLAILLQMAEMKAFAIDGDQRVRLTAGQAIDDGPWVKLDAYFTLRAVLARPVSENVPSKETQPTLDKVIQLASVAA